MIDNATYYSLVEYHSRCMFGYVVSSVPILIRFFEVSLGAFPVGRAECLLSVASSSTPLLPAVLCAAAASARCMATDAGRCLRAAQLRPHSRDREGQTRQRAEASSFRFRRLCCPFCPLSPRPAALPGLSVASRCCPSLPPRCALCSRAASSSSALCRLPMHAALDHRQTGERQRAGRAPPRQGNDDESLWGQHVGIDGVV